MGADANGKRHVSSNKLGFSKTLSPAQAWEGVFLLLIAPCRQTETQAAIGPETVMMLRAFWPLATPSVHTLVRLLF